VAPPVPLGGVVVDFLHFFFAAAAFFDFLHFFAAWAWTGEAVAAGTEAASRTAAHTPQKIEMNGPLIPSPIGTLGTVLKGSLW
jgi:hypothetical protein